MKPNILIISNYSDPVTPIRPEAEIMLRLQKQGFQLVVMTPDAGVYPTKLREAGCTIIDHRPKSKFDLKSVRLIRKAVTDHNIAIVHAFHSKAIANAAWALLFHKHVKLVTYRGYTGNIHWYDPSNYLSYLNPRVDYMVCLAESVREMYLKNGVSPMRAITIHKGHDPSWYADVETATRDREGIPEENMVCSLVANSRTKMKGIQYVAEAAALLPTDVKVSFLMIGDGLEDATVKRKISELGVGSMFIFTGYRKDAASLVKASDVVISASLFGEATQKAVIEALYMGKPVIITDISGNRGMVVNGETGLIVAAGSGQELSEAVLKYYKSPELRSRFGEAGKEHIIKFLSVDKTASEYAAFYEGIVLK